MNPTTVFSPRRPARSAGTPAVARPLTAWLAAAALVLPAVDSVLAQAPGSKDPYFKPATVAATIYAVLYEPYGTAIAPTTILAAGDSAYDENLQPDGSIKFNFVPPTFGGGGRIIFAAAPEVFTASGQVGPKVLLGGLFGQSATQIALRQPGQNIARILVDGTQDSSFNVGAGSNNYITSILPLSSDPNHRIVVGGLFTTFNLQPRLRIVRLNNDGTIDGSFNNSSAFDGDVLALAEGRTPGMGTTDGTVLVAGTFNHVGGQAVTKLARLDANGNLDPTFKPVIDTRVLAITVQPTGKIIIGGEFTNINGTPVSRIARLNYDGSLDTSFSASVSGLPSGESAPVAVYVLNQLKDPNRNSTDPSNKPDPLYSGKIYVGGNFTQVDGVTRRYLGVINPNGTVGSFDPGTTIYDKVQSVFVQPNGRLLIGETLGPKIGKTYQPSLIRLFGATTFD